MDPKKGKMSGFIAILEISPERMDPKKRRYARFFAIFEISPERMDPKKRRYARFLHLRGSILSGEILDLDVKCKIFSSRT